MDNEKDLVRKGYDEIATKYMSVRRKYVNYRYLERLDALLKPGSSILDLGCGSGKPLDRFFIDHGHSVTGIDISKTQIKLAKINVPEARYTVKDITNLREKEYNVDAVVSFYTIIHIKRETHQELFGKINSFLPVGGLILLTMATSESEGIEDFFGVRMYFSHFGSEKNREIIENAGFEIIIDEIDTHRKEKTQMVLAKKIS